jgi:DNA helicase-2/ATP-dependent DNA helicase PcrA
LNAFGFGILRDHFPSEYGKVSKEEHARRFQWLRKELAKADPDRHAALFSDRRDSFYLGLFGLLKNKLVDPSQLDAQLLADTLLTSRVATELFPDPSDEDLVRTTIEAIAWLFVRLDHLMRQRGLLDFEDQKLRAFVCLDKHPIVAAAIRARYDEVVVDEFQDINELDFALIELIARGKPILVTGDDDQSIYGFRGTTPEYIIDLERHLDRPVESHTLEVNYRCPPNIVAHAVRLIEHNTRRLPKRQVPFQTKDADVKVIPSISTGIESRVLRDYIRALLSPQPDGHTVKPADIAILYRTNAQSLPLQVELILADIPYQVRSDDNILVNDVLERLLGALRCRTAFRAGREPHVDDAVHLVRGYFRGLRPVEESALRDLLSRFVASKVIHSNKLAEVVPKAASSAIVSAVDDLCAASTLNDAMSVLTSEFHGMSGMIGTLEDAADGRAPLVEILEVAANFRDPEEFVTVMERAMAQASSRAAGSDPDGIQLLTYFRSKGRQWHTVILISCNEGLIPHRRSDVEEERRLFYVGLTRASKNLLVSYVDHAATGRSTPSRFLREAGLLPDAPQAVLAPSAPTKPVRRAPSGPDEHLAIGHLGPHAVIASIYFIQTTGSMSVRAGPQDGEQMVKTHAHDPAWIRVQDPIRPNWSHDRASLLTLPELVWEIKQGPVDDEAVRRLTLFAKIHGIVPRPPGAPVGSHEDSPRAPRQKKRAL